MMPRVVVVTGASAGVGRAIARAFGRRRAHVGLLARDPERLERARAEIELLGGRAGRVGAGGATPDGGATGAAAGGAGGRDRSRAWRPTGPSRGAG
jgi:NAD(P)-dependent dehydrogenase (short-subunit alcohol dehydrogenase family)